MAVVAAFMVPHPPIIVPDIGRGEEKKIQKTIDAYQTAARKIGSLKPKTIVLLSPHQVLYSDYFHISPGKGASGDFAQFRAPQVQMEIQYDTEFVEQICKLADAADFPAGTEGERDKQLDHGTMVPLYFVNQYVNDYQLVRIGLSGLPLKMHYQLGQYIQKAAKLLNRTTVLIASGDLSHRLKEDGPYGYQEEGPEYDSRIMDVMGKAAFGELFQFSEKFCEKAGECGHRSFTIMAGALDQLKVEAKALSYEGVFGVGYGVCSYMVCGNDTERNFKEQFEEKERAKIAKQKDQEDAYVQLARKTIESYVRTGEKITVPDGLPQELYSQRAGVFVSIKENGSLRGCIGTIHAVQTTVAQEVIENAISAACRDPRFLPVREEELGELVVSVDVLGDTEVIDTPDKLDVKRYGVIVTKGCKRGLLLPNLDGIDTVEEQIAVARRKAGIGEEEDITLERFEVIRHF
ncbi:MAG: AmmeMemoRadiSam system protein A [Lachnospiraceae bacterium]|nr:AmmeMemoRadiSam system protein A [Lachnospiraceae bacterium]